MTVVRETPLASLDLLRQITDGHVVDQLLVADASTRAEIAARTGISKPTISESMRRLETAGVVVEAGRQQGQRGRAGTFYSLREDLGFALALSASQQGLVAETRDVRGRLLYAVRRDVLSPITAAELGPVLLEVVGDALARTPGPPLGCALSVAGPVDRRTGRLVHLPDSPFLVDEIDLRSTLAPVLGADLQIDNDVNWAALAESREGIATDLDDFFYGHLGFGIGGAVIRGGSPVRGHDGLAGELAHVRTIGPRGRGLRLVECFAAAGLLRAGSAVIDVPRLESVLHGGTTADRRTRDAVVEAVAGALASVIALLNPAGVVVGGLWHATADFHERLTARLGELAVFPVPLRSAELGEQAPLTGARLVAMSAAQERVKQVGLGVTVSRSRGGGDASRDRR